MPGSEISMMLDKTDYAVVLDTDAALSLSLRHMFTVICGLSCTLYSDPEGFLDGLNADAAPELVILGRSGSMPRAEVLAQIKARSESFILVLNRQETPGEAEEAYLAGADDVMRLPLGMRELALRLRARIGMLADEAGEAIFRDSESWDSEAYIAGQAGLTAAEAQIAHILFTQSGEIVSRDTLSHAIDGRPWDYGDRKFDVHVAKIRKKLTSVFGAHISVQTVRSAGYVLTIEPDGPAPKSPNEPAP